MKREITIAVAHRQEFSNSLSRTDRLIIGQALADVGDNGEVRRKGRAYSDVPDLGFKCREMSFSGGDKGIGLLTVFSLEISEDEIVVLFAKAGGSGNLSTQERNRLREIYRDEMKLRGLEP